MVESYALFLATLLLIGGSLGDLYGRRKIFAAGVVLFFVASAWCGLAPNIRQLIVARGLQGIGGALLVPGSLALISANFPEKERGRAIGTWSGFTSITAAIGPVLGGWFIEHGSWIWVFFINIPPGLAVLWLTLWKVPESRSDNHSQQFDWLGPVSRARLRRNRSGIDRVHAGRRRSWRRGPNGAVVLGGAHIVAHGSAPSVSRDFQRSEPAHLISLFRLERNALLSPARFDTGAGNHDGMVFGQGSSAPQVPTLDAFLTNFCAPEPVHRLTRGPGSERYDPAGVYFTLDAPFVSIIGLYSNVLDGPGIISSQGGHFPIVDDQLDFLKSELARLKPDRVAGKRAVILAVHHPPLSADAKHGGSTGIMKDLDACCKAAGLWPDVLLSGHAHLYQRFTRTLPNGQQTPYLVVGSGGFAATTPKQLPPAPITVGDHTLESNPIVDFGYISVATDARIITLTFKTADGGPVRVRDSVSVNLKTGRIGSITEPVPAMGVAAKKRSKKKK